MIYSIYHIPGIKIGCSDNPKGRVRKQGYTEYTILETHTDIYVASDREQELQKEYGYRVDECPYYKSIIGNKEAGKIQGDKNVASGHMQRICGLGGKIGGATNVQSGHIQKLANINNNKIRICPHCNTEMKGPIYFRYHGDNCKYA